ncbi:MAG: hypothetical protein ACRDRP_03425 [Pseudonocardiaceae bacterium]
MARPDQVRLTITAKSGSRTSTVTVCYVVRFNDADVKDNLRYRETITLFGEDPPPGPAGDDPLFTFPPITVRPDGQRTRTFCRTAEVRNRILDEDRGHEEDEIYARVCLSRRGQQRCAQSGFISQLVAEESGSAEEAES